MAFARVSGAPAPPRTAPVSRGERSPASAPRASPAMSIAHAPRTTAAAMPMQNVTSSVARKSTTIGRTLDLLLEASIAIPFWQCPLRALPGIEAPEKGSGGRAKWKAAEELWQEDGSASGVGARREGMRYIHRGFVSPPFLRRGGAKRRGGLGAYHHPAACGGTPPRGRRGGAHSTTAPRLALRRDH